jgi:hypothetical protein
VFGLGGSFPKREPEVRCHEVKSERTIVFPSPTSIESHPVIPGSIFVAHYPQLMQSNRQMTITVFTPELQDAQPPATKLYSYVVPNMKLDIYL